MRALSAIALFVALGASFSYGQQASPSAPPPVPDAQPDRVKVFAVGPGVTAPELVPLNMAPIPAGKCKKKWDGKVTLSFLVDTTGRPRNIMFLKPLGSDLDRLALQIAAADRFKPGTYDGAPAVIGQSVEVSMQACVAQINDNAGKKNYILRLRSQPVQNFGPLPNPPEEAVLASSESTWKDSDSADIPVYRVGAGVTAPVVLHDSPAQYSDEARRAKHEGECLLSTIVDAHGMPQYVRVVRTLGMGLDEKAVEAVNQYRFKPAMKDGMPVPVMVNVEVNFRLY